MNDRKKIPTIYQHFYKIILSKNTQVNKILILLLFTSLSLKGQNEFNFDGQLSTVSNWSPSNNTWGLLNARYLPELNYNLQLDSTHTWYFEASANLWASSYFHKDSITTDGDISPYRIWTRFAGEGYEIRVGLQKIDFGSAMTLRPLQWFNGLDVRDPLGITEGVNAILGRYYFSNNANIWLWGLYGNEDTRGFDVVKSHKKSPEFGGRFQFPVGKGELAFSYNHRTANANDLLNTTELEKIPENRIGLDGKWDIGIGLWFETSYIKKQKDVGDFTHQTLATLGMDYTFPLGNGLNTVVEHLVVGYDQNNLGFNNNSNITALNVSYPVGFFDNLSMFMTYSWEEEKGSFFLNYQHSFPKITGYFMAYYTPSADVTLAGDKRNDFVSSFTGFGLRVMLVFKH
jgi:hypothetical protein